MADWQVARGKRQEEEEEAEAEAEDFMGKVTI